VLKLSETETLYVTCDCSKIDHQHHGQRLWQRERCVKQGPLPEGNVEQALSKANQQQIGDISQKKSSTWGIPQSQVHSAYIYHQWLHILL
jgi:hypothetical protein